MRKTLRMQSRAKSGVSTCFTAAILIAALPFSPFELAGKPAYRIFKNDGSAASYDDMITALAKSDIVFFGELHGNPVIHWLQYETAADLFAASRGMMDLGAEMLETDQQMIIDEYLSGAISEGAFLRDARLWPHHRRDYQRLLDLAREKHARFIATNAPRRYSALVFSKGIDALRGLGPGALKYITPLPFEIPPREAAPDPAELGDEWSSIHRRGNWLEAQALKDATMAHFIAKNRRDGALFLHFNGSGHSDFSRGIPRYLSLKNDRLKIATVSSVIQDDVRELAEKHRGRAHFILCVPSAMVPGE